ELLAQAVLAFVQAENWAASRQVIEDQQALLLRPEVEQVFEAFLSQVPDNPQVRDMLDLHRRILRACRKDGIEAAFAQIETAPQADAAAQLPDDVVAEWLKGFGGTPQDKMAAYTYLSALLTDGPPGLGALVAVAQAALFMPDPTQADSSSLE